MSSNFEQDECKNDELIFGRNAVLAFLASSQANEKAHRAYGDTQSKGRQISKVLMADGLRTDRRLEEIKRLAKHQGVPFLSVNKKKMDRLVGPDNRHQGVLAYVSKVEMLSLDDLLYDLSGFQKGNDQKDELDHQVRPPVVALLDGIEDPQNLGAIVRVAECAGLKAILLPARRSASITGTVAKASAGAIATLPVVRIGNTVNALEQLKKLGFWIVGLDLKARQNYFDADLNGPLAVVIGSEGRGLGRLVAESCDFLVRIPMFGKTGSLNASVAAGIVFYEIVRQRQGVTDLD